MLRKRKHKTVGMTKPKKRNDGLFADMSFMTNDLLYRTTNMIICSKTYTNFFDIVPSLRTSETKTCL